MYKYSVEDKETHRYSQAIHLLDWFVQLGVDDKDWNVMNGVPHLHSFHPIRVLLNNRVCELSL